MPHVTYINILTFPIALQFKNRALGVWRKVNIGDLTGTLHLPRPNLEQIEMPFNNLLPPKVKGVEVATRIYEQVESDNREPIRWGGYFTFNRADPENTSIAVVRHAILAIPSVQSGVPLTVEEVGNKCFKDFPTWSNRLIDWIEVLTGVDLDSVHPLSSSISTDYWTSVAWIHGTKKGDFHFVNPGLNLLGSSGENSLDLQVWDRVIRCANSNRDIPDAWALLRDAHRAQRRTLYRRAILDMATAAELVIDTELRNRLGKRNPRPFTDQIMRNSSQVSRRIELMSTLSMWLPKNIQSRLFEVRNRVIHKNVAVTSSDAKDAVSAGDELVRHYASRSLR